MRQERKETSHAHFHIDGQITKFTHRFTYRLLVLHSSETILQGLLETCNYSSFSPLSHQVIFSSSGGLFSCNVYCISFPEIFSYEKPNKGRVLKKILINHMCIQTLNEHSPATQHQDEACYDSESQVNLVSAFLELKVQCVPFLEILPKCPTDPWQGICLGPCSGPEAWIGLPPVHSYPKHFVQQK